MPLVDVGPTRLHVVDLGEAGPRVVMLHGLLLGNVATWFFGAASALAPTHRVRLFDLRGHGRSERPATGYDLPTLATDLDALVDTDRVVLVGHSWGALVALRWALDHPERVDGLVLVEPPRPPGAPGEIGAFLDRDPEAMLDALPAALREAAVGGKRQARKLLARLVALASETTLLADLEATKGFAEEALVGLDVPVLVLNGDRSDLVADGAWYARVLPRAERRVLAGDHYLPVTAGEAVTEAVVGWVRGLLTPR